MSDEQKKEPEVEEVVTEFEGGIRVPAIISWPGHLPEGATRDQIAVACDWLPTLADLAGVNAPEGLDGKSLSAVVRDDAASPHAAVHWQTGPEKTPQWAVRCDGRPGRHGRPGAPAAARPRSRS